MSEREGPDATAMGAALWRAAHLVLDDAPHILHDDLALRLVDAGPDWLDDRLRSPALAPWRASLLARARFLEDFVEEHLAAGVDQLVLLGAGMDTLALRRLDLLAALRVFEADVAATQAWKQRRIRELRLPVPRNLRFVSVDFECGESWLDAVARSGFDRGAPVVVASLGVNQYLTIDAISETFRQPASLAPGSSYVSTFILRPDLVGDEESSLRLTAAMSADGGHPWLSLFAPNELIEIARAAGFADIKRVTADDLVRLYFTGRSDSLRPARAEEILVATR